jgi:UDP-N-acetylmuramate dehydrogenase
LVHRGGGTTSELLSLARAIRDGVRSRFGVELEPEPVMVGCAL